MRVLHLFSNYKWTGPAEPAVSLAAGLRRAGLEVVLRSSGWRPPDTPDFLVERAAAWQITPVTDLQLRKHRSLVANAGDVRRLRAILEAEPIDILHTHLPNDHRIARRARRALPSRARPALVRTFYDTDPEALSSSLVRELARETDAVLVFSRAIADRLGRGPDLAGRVHRIDTSIDLERFAPDRDLPDLRPELGFGPDDFLAGIVARVQPQRRFDLLLDAAERLAEELPRFRLVIIGRGSHLEEVARTPARERGLLDRVVFFPGYVSGDRYVALLRALDVKLFLVPGTDGTARAVREALALGLPVICTRRGMLPELIDDDRTGLLCDEHPTAFVDAIRTLAEDPDRRHRMGAAAAAYAREHFALDRQVAQVRAVYEALCAEEEVEED